MTNEQNVIITEEEYFEAMIKAYQEEVKRYEERLTKHFGGKTKISLA